ncbi:hypothetical protein JCM17961_29310 [Endothiovibrio diazotrophicus]
MDLLLKQILPFKGKSGVSRTLERHYASREALTARMERLVAQSRRAAGARHTLVVERPKYRRGWPNLRWRESGHSGPWATWESVCEALPPQPPSLRDWYAEIQAHVIVLNGAAGVGAAIHRQLLNVLTDLTELEAPE